MKNEPFHYHPEDFPDPHADEVDWGLIDMLLELTPAQRLERMEQFAASARAIQAAGEQYYESLSATAQTPR